MAGRHNPREKRRSACAQDGQVCAPHPCHNPSRNHCMSHRQKKCHTQLTRCDEGNKTREGNTWRGDMSQDRKECQQVHKMGQVCAPRPCHNPSRNQCMRHRQKKCHTQLTSCDEGTITREGNTWRGYMNQERIESQQVHKMGQVCAPHPCHNPSRNQRMHHRKNLLHNRTH